MIVQTKKRDNPNAIRDITYDLSANSSSVILFATSTFNVLAIRLAHGCLIDIAFMLTPPYLVINFLGLFAKTIITHTACSYVIIK